MTPDQLQHGNVVQGRQVGLIAVPDAEILLHTLFAAVCQKLGIRLLTQFQGWKGSGGMAQRSKSGAPAGRVATAKL
jgi:hypothetical protein